jgi:hypothetical protein
MSRLGLLASSALIAMASAAHSATVKFEALRQGSSVSLTCGTTSCPRLKAELEIDEDDLPSATLGPAFKFGFIEFDTKGRRPANTSGDFGITANLAFRIIGVPGLYKVIANGIGKFGITGEKITALTLEWADIDNVVIPNVGTLAFRLSDINLASAFANRDTNDSNGSGSGSSSSTDDLLTVSATVENASVVPLPGGVVLLLSALGLIGIGAARRSRTAA